MRLNIGSIVPLLALVVPACASALTLSWQQGTPDISPNAATRCTLVVEEARGLSGLPGHWRLVWSTGEGGAPLEILSIPVPADPHAAVPCAIQAPPAGDDSTNNVAYEDFCDQEATGTATRAYYVLDVAASTRARIGLVSSDQPGEPERLLSSITVNGALDLPLPPQVDALSSHWLGERIFVRAAGVGLAQVSAAAVAFRDSTPSVSLAVVNSEDGSLSLSSAPMTSIPPLTAGAHLELATPAGHKLTVTPSPDVLSPTTCAPPPHLIIRFKPSSLEPPAEHTGGMLESFQVASTSLSGQLAAAGVTALYRLLPEFQHSDTISTNDLGEAVSLPDLADIYVALVRDSTDLLIAQEALSTLPEIEYAAQDPLSPGFASLVPNDPLFNQQWGFTNSSTPVCSGFPAGTVDVGATDAWEFFTGVRPTRIAILDSGIRPEHEEFANAVELGPCTAVLECDGVPCGGICEPCDNSIDGQTWSHGTAVASIATARGNNGTGIAGVSWSAVPVSIKLNADTQYGICPSSLVGGIAWADQAEIPILNMSVDLFHDNSGRVYPDDDDLQPLNDVCRAAFLRGKLLVAAAGNQNEEWPSYPAGYARSVLAVGAVVPGAVSELPPTRWDDNVLFDEIVCPWYYYYPWVYPPTCGGSNKGTWLDIAAPGGRFIPAAQGSTSEYWATTLDCQMGDIGNVSSQTAFGGTSAAAPVVSGVAALLKDYSPSATGEDLSEILRRTATPLSANPVDVGAGLVNAAAALNFIRHPKQLSHNVTLNEVGSPNYRVYVANPDTAAVSLHVQNIPGVYPLTQQAKVFRVRVGFRVSFTPLAGPPIAWARSSGTLGAEPPSYNDDDSVFAYRWYLHGRQAMPWARVIAFTEESALFETYVYEFPENSGPTRWWPCDTTQVKIAYSVLYTPTIVGVEDPEDASRIGATVSPNPVRGRAAIALRLARRGHLRVSVYDLLGRRVAALHDGPVEAGKLEFTFPGAGSRVGRLSAGAYFLKVELDGEVLSRKFALLEPSL